MRAEALGNIELTCGALCACVRCCATRVLSTAAMLPTLIRG